MYNHINRCNHIGKLGDRLRGQKLGGGGDNAKTINFTSTYFFLTLHFSNDFTITNF